MNAQLNYFHNLLHELVEINSWTLNIVGVNQVQDRLAQEFEKLNLTVKRVKFSDRGDTLIATTPSYDTNNHNFILLSGHADTVHLPDSPFTKLTIDQDFWHGPGISDMKGGLVMILWALKNLYELEVLSKIPLKILINSAEENSTALTRSTVVETARDARLALVVEPIRPEHYIVLERSGLLMYEIEVTGKEAHVGNHFLNGASAINQLARNIIAIENLTDVSRRVFANVGVIRGGSSDGVIAGSANLSFEIRLPKESLLEEFREKANKAIFTPILGVIPNTQTKILVQEYFPPLETLPSTLHYLTEYQKAGERHGVNFKVLPQVGGLSDANQIAALKVPTIDAIGPLGFGEHTPNERLFMPSLEEQSIILSDFLMNL
jgi:glutamate carboxypeptidase